MKKIILVAPYLTMYKSDTLNLHSIKRMMWVPPLGIGYISSFLKLHGYNPKILDCVSSPDGSIDDLGKYIRFGLSPDKVKEYFKKEQPEVVGISCNFTSFSMDALEIAAIAKQANKDTIVIMGGAHATMDYLNIIQDPNVDMVIRGEGEYTLLEFLNNPDRLDIESTVIKNNGKIIENNPRPVIENLDLLPFPDYESINMDFYLGGEKKGFAEKLLNQKIGFMVSSRGCPYNCIFCSTCKVFKKFRGRSPINIAKELELLINKYKVKEILFMDDCFIASKKRVEDFCQELLKRKIKIRWSVPPGFNVWLADKELLNTMAKSGLFRVNFPIETGSPATLHFIRKPVNLKRANEIIKECNDLGIWTTGNFLIGFPYETMEDIELTAKYIYNSELDAVTVLICQPQIGSDLIEIYQKEGLLTHTPERGSSVLTTKYDTKYFKAKELNRIRSEIMVNFNNLRLKSFFTPQGFYRHIFKKINSPKKFKYFLGKVLRAFYRYNIFRILIKKGDG